MGAKKVRYVLRNPGKPNFLAGYPGICRDILEVPEKSEKKDCVQFSSPIGSACQRAAHTSITESAKKQSEQPALMRIVFGRVRCSSALGS